MTNPAASWADGPLIALDLETTNVDPRRDRLVTAAIVTITPTQPGQKPQVDLKRLISVSAHSYPNRSEHDGHDDLLVALDARHTSHHIVSCSPQ